MEEEKKDVKKKRGFAGMDPERQRLIASAGGKTAHATKRAHQFTSKEAKLAAAKSVEARRKKKGVVK